VLPKQTTGPWAVHQNYVRDTLGVHYASMRLPDLELG
jgi:hypothetical protein